MNYAVLNPQFFIDYPPKADFYHKWANLYAWSEQVLPLYEWNNLIYVGCADVPVDLPKTFIPLICDVASLKQCWSVYTQNFDASEKTALISAQEPAPELSVPKKTAINNSANDDLFAELEKTVLSQPQANSANLEANSILQETADESLDVIIEENEPLEGFDLPAEPKEKRATPVSVEPIVGDLSELFHSAPAESTKPAVSAAVASKPTPAQVAATISAAPASINPAVVNLAAVEEIFKELKYHYSKAMILTKEGHQLKPWKWDSGFRPNQQDVKKYNLTTPSPFRIVERTQKSYHGYVVSNDFNEQFFDEWNESQNPAHLTVSPILVNDQVVAMLLAIGDKNANTKKSLQLSEQCALKLSMYFKANPKAA